MVLKASCQHYSGTEAKLEKNNKRALIRGSSASVGRGVTKLHPSLAQLSSGMSKNRNKNGYFFEAIFEYLRHYEQLYDERKHVMSLHLTSINLILSSILQER